LDAGDVVRTVVREDAQLMLDAPSPYREPGVWHALMWGTVMGNAILAAVTEIAGPRAQAE
jgi:hypothetical protein